MTGLLRKVKSDFIFIIHFKPIKISSLCRTRAIHSNQTRVQAKNRYFLPLLDCYQQETYEFNFCLISFNIALASKQPSLGKYPLLPYNLMIKNCKQKQWIANQSNRSTKRQFSWNPSIQNSDQRNSLEREGYWWKNYGLKKLTVNPT